MIPRTGKIAGDPGRTTTPAGGRREALLVIPPDRHPKQKTVAPVGNNGLEFWWPGAESNHRHADSQSFASRNFSVSHTFMSD